VNNASQHTRPCTVVLTDPQTLRSDDPQTLVLACLTPRLALVGPGKELPPPWSESRNACC